MAERTHAITASRSAWLALREDLQLVNDGYEFLDEKRILLAALMLRQRAIYSEARAEFQALCESAAAALRDAAAELGLDGLQVHPAAELGDARLQVQRQPAVGLVMLKAKLDAGVAELSRSSLQPAPEVRTCKRLFEDLLSGGAALAAMSTNLQRLTFEYRRTERRVRALENVVLPEIRDDLTIMEEHLDLIEQEEVIRVRSSRSESRINRVASPGDR